LIFTFHPFASAALWGRFLQFLASYRQRNHPCQIVSRLVKGLGGYGSPKSGVFHWLWMSLLQQCCALTCYTVINVRQMSPPDVITDWKYESMSERPVASMLPLRVYSKRLAACTLPLFSRPY